jgi:hypothetical protein
MGQKSHFCVRISPARFVSEADANRRRIEDFTDHFGKRLRALFHFQAPFWAAFAMVRRNREGFAWELARRPGVIAVRSCSIRKRRGSEAWLVSCHQRSISPRSPPGRSVSETSETTMKYEPTSKIFTLDVAGRPTVSFEAISTREANELLKEHWFRDDLQLLTSDGAPLWDGVAQLRSRPANEQETERYQGIAAEADDAAGDILLAFLVTLDRVRR